MILKLTRALGPWTHALRHGEVSPGQPGKSWRRRGRSRRATGHTQAASTNRASDRSITAIESQNE